MNYENCCDWLDDGWNMKLSETNIEEFSIASLAHFCSIPRVTDYKLLHRSGHSFILVPLARLLGLQILSIWDPLSIFCLSFCSTSLTARFSTLNFEEHNPFINFLSHFVLKGPLNYFIIFNNPVSPGACDGLVQLYKFSHRVTWRRMAYFLTIRVS